MGESLDRSHIPQTCGVYLMRDAQGTILYIGKAKNLARRVAQYFMPEGRGEKNAILAPLIRKVDYIACASERESLLLERRLINRHQPFFNVVWKDDKSYPYIKITSEDFPRILLTRRKVRDGGVYFGPYPKVSPIRGLLKYLWRQKLVPLRPCRWEFSADKPLDPRKVSACLYYHTGECPAPCAGKISVEKYRDITANAVLFFQGDYAKLADALALEMKERSAEMNYERAALLRDNVAALRHMGERVRVEAVREEDVTGHLAGSEAVSDLKAVLGLKTPPVHIECFDISHFQGHQTVASMVCFQAGLPHKDHYRRFKIREVQGIDDFASMAEVVGRRYRKLKPLPDLIVVDGGKGQLSAAVKVLKELKVKTPIVSLAKRIEEVFVPGRDESILLDFGRPALRLLQQLRDEAHRFGINYHRLLRGKALFEEV
jgi:excinuclease ABC subunit C